MNKLFVRIVSLFFAIVISGCSNGKRAAANEALGGPVTITCQVWKSSKNGYSVETNRTVELNYDLKKTLDHAKSVRWNCKCPVQDTMMIDDEFYNIFGRCRSQDGCQLISRGDEYYLIKKKLSVLGK